MGHVIFFNLTTQIYCIKAIYSAMIPPHFVRYFAWEVGSETFKTIPCSVSETLWWCICLIIFNMTHTCSMLLFYCRVCILTKKNLRDEVHFFLISFNTITFYPSNLSEEILHFQNIFISLYSLYKTGLPNLSITK